MSKRFEHLGEVWEATGTGTGYGVASGRVPQATHWGVTFRCVSDPSKGEVRGEISDSDPAEIQEARLRKELEGGLVLRAIEESEFEWRTAEGLSRETGIPVDEVRALLEGMPNEVIRSFRPDPKGRPLYTTRDRYKTERGFWKRYLDVLDWSTT